MTFRPPLSLENAGPVEEAIDWRHLIGAIFAALGAPGGGVIGSSSLACTQQATGATPSVNVGSGPCVIVGSAAQQGSYFCYSDAVANVPLVAPDATHIRIDTIIAQLIDTEFGGGTDEWKVTKVNGTPGASSGPTLPDDCLALHDVKVPANGVGALVITDRRPRIPNDFHVNGDEAIDGDLTVGGQTNFGADVIGDAAMQAALGGLFGHGSILPNGTSFLLVVEALIASKLVNYALQQAATGDTFLNAKAGQQVHIRIGNNATDVISIGLVGGAADIEIAQGLPNATGDGNEFAVLYHTGTGKLSRVVSSRRFKEDEEALAASVDTGAVIDAVVPQTFVHTADTSRRRAASIIAEDIADVFPQGARYDAAGLPGALDTEALVAVLWDEVRSLRARLATAGL